LKMFYYSSNNLKPSILTPTFWVPVSIHRILLRQFCDGK
jgi:hypothetical protein